MDNIKQPYAVEDPAYRDVDALAWRAGRFEERIRRAWNPIRTADIESAGGNIEALIDIIHAKVGGDRDEIEHRVRAFDAAERSGALHAHDPLLRPGSH
jgi:hypothetical protein